MPIATLYHSETTEDAKYLVADLEAQGCNFSLGEQKEADAKLYHDKRYTRVLADLKYYKITIEKVTLPNPEEK